MINSLTFLNFAFETNFDSKEKASPVAILANKNVLQSCYNQLCHGSKQTILLKKLYMTNSFFLYYQ